MQKYSKIYVAGNTGLVGSALIRNLQLKGYSNLVFTPFPEYDLLNQKQTENFFSKEKPEYVFFAAAKVGGIVANNTYRGQFIYENLQIQNNIIHQSYLNGVKKLLFLGSSCIYPKNCPQPMSEEHLLTSELEYTNEPYAIAKIAGLKMCESYNLQYGTNFIAVMPTNLYGRNDNFDLEKSHVLPALMRKMHLGKCLENNDWDAIRKDLNKNPVEKVSGKDNEKDILKILQKYGIAKTTNVSVELWGTGSPYREFLFSDDLADACVYLMENYDIKKVLKNEFGIENPVFPLTQTEVRNIHINIGSGEETTIKDLAYLIKSIVGYKGIIIWNSDKPDGTPRKLLDGSKLNKYGWFPKVRLKEGLSKMYDLYIA